MGELLPNFHLQPNPPQWNCWATPGRCPPVTATSHVLTGAHLDHTSAPPRSLSHWQPYLLPAAKAAPRNHLASALALIPQNQLVAWSCQLPWTHRLLLPWTHCLAQAFSRDLCNSPTPPSQPPVLSACCSQMELTNLQSPLLLNASQQLFSSHHRSKLINVAPKLCGVWPPPAPSSLTLLPLALVFPSGHTDLLALRPSCLQASACAVLQWRAPFPSPGPGSCSASFSPWFKHHCAPTSPASLNTTPFRINPTPSLCFLLDHQHLVY